MTDAYACATLGVIAMKRSTTNQLSKKFSRALIIPVIVAVGLFQFTQVTHVFADTYDDQINQLQNDINGYQAEAGRLQAESNTLQNAINALSAQKMAIQGQIDLSQAKLNQLTDEIAKNQIKLEKQQKVLGSTISDLSAESTTSPIELLAGSHSIGDFIDRQEYRSSVQDQIQNAITTVKALKVELATQKKEVEAVILDQQKQHDLLSSKEAEQASLLAQTQGQEAQYQNMVAQKNSQVSALRAQQAAAMRAANASNGTVYGSSSYPWMDSSMQYDDYCNYYSGGSAADPWGYCKRQCVSYVAWKLNSDGRGNRGYSGLGNANNWGAGGSYVPVADVQPGDAIIWYIGSYGHVMYVDYVSGDTVGISQMNVPYDSGKYSTSTYSKRTLSNGAYEVRRFH